VTISWAVILLGHGSSAQIWVANSPGNPHDAAVRCRTVNEENGDSRAADPARRCSTTSVHAVTEVIMDQSSVAENEVERARLKAIVARLTDVGLSGAMSEAWTIGVGLMQLAFWDGLPLSKFEDWERTNTVQIPSQWDVVKGMNHAMLHRWQTIAPTQIRHAVRRRLHLAAIPGLI